jgi:O-antigen ligase
MDLNHTAFFSRLRAPLAYWNALSLFCVLAVPIAIQAAEDPVRRARTRSASIVALVLLLTTIGLTYSRGGVAALAIVVLVLLLAGRDRLRTAAVAAAGVIGAAPALTVGFTRSDLTHDLVPLSQRTGDGLMFAAALAAGAVAAVYLERLLGRRAERVALGPLQRRRAVAIAAVGALLAVALAAGGLAASDRGLTGSVSDGFDSFKSVKFERQNDPARILQTNSGNRWVWWSEAMGAWSDRPVAGWGAGSFPLLHHRYRHNGLEVLQPHSVPLQFLSEVGAIGTLIALAALGLLTLAAGRRVLSGARAERAGVPAGGEHRYAVALFAGVVAWLVHMWFDWDWDIPGVALPLFAFLGLLAARPLGMPGRALTPLRSGPVVGRRLAALALGAALACAVALSAALPSLARDHTQAATDALSKRDYAAAVREADIARRLNPVAVDPLLLEARAAGRRGQFALASRLLTDAVHRQPDNPDVWFGVARLELARGDVPAMRAAARHMLELDPVAPAGRFFFLSNDLGVRSATATGTPLSP